MSSSRTTEPPPSYDQVATGASTTTNTTTSAAAGSSSSAHPNEALQARKSLEDTLRPLPHGWIRQFDPSTQHNFFVDTLAKPPRSIWVHPFDDPDFQKSHPDEVRRERERIEKEHIVHADTDDEDSEDHHHHHSSKDKGHSSHHHSSAAATSAAAGSSTANEPAPKGLKKFGRNLKDKMTNTTHAEREAKRAAQKEAERKAMEQHAAIRRALNTATQTGQPQLIGRDKQGRDIYAQPPPPGAYGYGATLGYSPYQTTDGPYGPYGPYDRPMGPYNRGYGYGGMGYGGMGMGMPLMGGMMGGMLLGGLLF